MDQQTASSMRDLIDAFSRDGIELGQADPVTQNPKQWVEPMLDHVFAGALLPPRPHPLQRGPMLTDHLTKMLPRQERVVFLGQIRDPRITPLRVVLRRLRKANEKLFGEESTSGFDCLKSERLLCHGIVTLDAMK